MKNNDKLDVIGIGAINIDYIFHNTSKDNLGAFKNTERANESLNATLDEKILNRQVDKGGCESQLGGSALLTIRTIAALNAGLKTGYVGCIGTSTDLERNVGHPKDLYTSLNFVDDKSWLFHSTNYPGRAEVKLYKGIRQRIRIDAGANNELMKFIKEKNNQINKTSESKNSAFLDYLLTAKWIHISSLAKIEHFEFIMGFVKEAKEKNRLIKISIDPGVEYAVEHREMLSKYLSFMDYIFLNENEFNGLAGDENMVKKNKIDSLNNLLNQSMKNNKIVFIQKGKRKNTVLNFINNKPFSRDFYHERLSWFSIFNDTGAGDVFAGGVIAGLLTPQLISHQPIPIKIGALLAKKRLKSNKFPDKELAVTYSTFIESNLRAEFKNNSSRIKTLWNAWGHNLITVLLGMLSSYLIYVLTMQSSKNDKDIIEQHTNQTKEDVEEKNIETITPM